MKLVVASCGLWLVACVGVPQSEDVLYGPQKGESLLSLGGSFSSSRLDVDGVPTIESAIFTGRAAVGYFFTLEHEAGVQLTYDRFETNLAGGDQTRGDVLLVYNYNLRQSSRTWYYFGADLGYRWLRDEDATNFNSPTYGIHVGLRQWLTPNVSVFAQPFWKRSEYETTIDDDATDTQLGVLYGLEFAF